MAHDPARQADYVVLRGWGVMNPIALKTASKVGFPADHIIGNVWSNSEEDVIPTGEAAKGYAVITTQASGAEYPVVQEIVKTIYDAGQGNLEDKNRIGSVYHNLGIVNGILNVEAIRIAQEKVRQTDADRRRGPLGFEHLQLDPARVEALGAMACSTRSMSPWDNHEGNGYVTFQAGGMGRSGTSSLTGSRRTGHCYVRIIEKSSEAYAAEKGIKLRTAADAETATN
ncbi:hypothetical protein ACOJBM_40850 [Rhizobium beringeri]